MGRPGEREGRGGAGRGGEGRGGEGRGGEGRRGGDLVEEEDVGRALGDVGEDEARLLACSCVMKDA